MRKLKITFEQLNSYSKLHLFLNWLQVFLENGIQYTLIAEGYELHIPAEKYEMVKTHIEGIIRLS